MNQSSLNRIVNAARTSTVRLTLSYLAIIMVMSIGFSIVFYNTSSHELGRRFPPPAFLNTIPDRTVHIYQLYVSSRVEEARTRLLLRLLLVNVSALLAGAFLSYVLARRTLQPIESAMEAQARFASDASHELRTPLAAIQAENEVALRNKHLSLERAKELLESNVDEVIRLRDLSDGLLRLAREDTHDLTMSTVSFSDVTNEAMNRILKAAQQKDITIEDRVDSTKAVGDSASIIQVLSVLLDNAVKYSPKSQTIVISSWTRNRKAYLSVTDRGIGIAKEHLPHIFDRFYRADSARSNRTAGYGLGLSIAYKIITQHGGTITVTSMPNQGSTFTICLPSAAS